MGAHDRPPHRDRKQHEAEPRPAKRAATHRDRKLPDDEPRPDRRAATHRDRKQHETEPPADPVDESSEESFPASDPPSWTPNTSLGPHKD